MTTSLPRTAKQWCAVIGDALMEEDFEILDTDVRSDYQCILRVEERPSPRAGASLFVNNHGRIATVDRGGGAAKVKAALKRQGLGNLLETAPDSWNIAHTSLPPKALKAISARQRSYINEFKFTQFKDGRIEASYDGEHMGTWNGKNWVRGTWNGKNWVR
jgi:hypothetical protein